MPTIWMVRTGEGKAKVHPSPCWLQPNQQFQIKNWTDTDALVTFGDAPIELPDPVEEWRRRLPELVAGIRIPAGSSATFRVQPGAVPAYYEYDASLMLGRLRLNVEGASKPAIIIDP